MIEIDLEQAEKELSKLEESGCMIKYDEVADDKATTITANNNVHSAIAESRKLLGIFVQVFSEDYAKMREMNDNFWEFDDKMGRVN